jgi:hypothetical protein
VSKGNTNNISPKINKLLNEGGDTNNSGPRVRCLKCLDIIQSLYRHDFKWCACQNIAVDGGADYLKMSYKPDAKYEILDDES